MFQLLWEWHTVIAVPFSVAEAANKVFLIFITLFLKSCQHVDVLGTGSVLAVGSLNALKVGVVQVCPTD